MVLISSITGAFTARYSGEPVRKFLWISNKVYNLDLETVMIVVVESLLIFETTYHSEYKSLIDFFIFIL